MTAHSVPRNEAPSDAKISLNAEEKIGRQEICAQELRHCHYTRIHSLEDGTTAKGHLTTWVGAPRFLSA